MKGTIDLIIENCKKHKESCEGCRFSFIGGCHFFNEPPLEWDADFIKNSLEEASDKEEVVVPEKWTDEMLY